MRLAINASRLAGRRTGVGRYLVNLLRRWALWNDTFEETILYTQAATEIGLLELSKNFRVKVIAPGMPGLLWENVALKSYARDADVLFCPSYTIPLGFKGRTVVTMHDATQEICSDTFSWWSRLRFAPLYRYSAQRATHIVTDSQVSKTDLLTVYPGIASEKITVIYPAPDTQFKPVADRTRLTETKQRFLRSQDPFVLFVGKMAVRRNIPILMEAFGWLKKIDKIPHRLLLVGLNTSQLDLAGLARRFGIADSLEHAEYVSDAELVLLYNAADLFVWPCTYEGFSLPILEAMACGTPVITVNSSALKEVAQEAAFLIDAPEVELLSHAMHRLLTDPALRRSLVPRGFARAREFSWDATARATLRVLQAVAAGPFGR